MFSIAGVALVTVVVFVVVECVGCVVVFADDLVFTSFVLVGTSVTVLLLCTDLLVVSVLDSVIN